jgi:hypothetical protein
MFGIIPKNKARIPRDAMIIAKPNSPAILKVSIRNAEIWHAIK